METVTDYISQIIDILNNAKDEYKKCTTQLSLLDRASQEILHRIELEPFNVLQGYSLSKQLRDIRILRRTEKCRMELLQILMGNLKSVNLEKVERKLRSKVKQQRDFVYKPQNAE